MVGLGEEVGSEGEGEVGDFGGEEEGDFGGEEGVGGFVVAPEAEGEVCI